MKTLVFGGNIKNLIIEFEKEFDVVCSINSIDDLKKDYNLLELIKNNFDFTPEFNEDAQKLFIEFYKSNIDTFLRMFIRRGVNLADYHELVNHFTLYFYCFYEILFKKKVELVLFNNFPHQGLDYVIYKLAKLMNIKTILLTQTIFPNKFIIVSDVNEFGLFEKKYSKFERSKINSILSKKDMYINFQNKIRSDLQKRGLPFSTHTSQSVYSPDYNYKKKISESNFLKISFFKNQLRKLFIKLKIINRKNYQKLFLNNLKKKELNDEKINKVLNNKEKKILIALHMQPEMSTSLLAGDYDDQIRIIEKIYRNKFSDNLLILVREHPSQTFYQRDELFFRRLKTLKNLKFINRDFPIEKLLPSMDFVVTSSGTIGWEALNLGKKCLLFGNSWYSNLHGVMKITNITSDEEIIKFFDEKFDNNLFNISLQNLYESFYDGIVLKSYIPWQPNFNEQNNSKKVINQIKKYLEKN